jgi:beta-phosphoglucomutase-like phosphatase (HAD superfamily)
MIKAVIFDMDGVLIEAKDWHYESLNKALNLFGYEISRVDHLTTFDGLPTKMKLEMLSKEKGLPIELHSFINEMKQIYTIELIHQLCKPNFIHEYAVSTLKTNGYKLAVASNSIRKTIELMMEKSFLSKYMDIMLSNEDVTNAKPDPEIYITTIERLNLNPEECLILEDNENGIRAAKASKAHVMIVNDVYDVTLENITNRIKEIETNE